MSTMKSQNFLGLRIHQKHKNLNILAGIPVWAPKLCVQIKGKLMQNNISYLISSMQIRVHVVRYLSNTLKNVELKTLCMPVCYCSLFKHITASFL